MSHNISTEKKTNTQSEADIVKQKNKLWYSTIIALCIGVLALFLISVFPGTWKGFTSAIGTSLLIAGGSLTAGGLLGFLFGIPSILQDSTSKIKYNDNLVKISDWLTTIIVGVGLVQLYKIPGFILKVGETFKYNIDNNEWGRNTVIAIMGYFGILGFLMLYFWSKTDYSSILDSTDRLINALKDTERKLEDATTEKEQAQQEKEQVRQEAISNFEQSQKDVAITVTHERVSNSQSLSDTVSIEQLKDNDGEIMKSEIEKLKQKVQSVISTKTTVVPDDLQKNVWGGKQERNGIKITAAVKKNNWQNLFDVLLRISKSDGSYLDKPVAVFLHDSYKFPNNVVFITPSNGEAELSFLAYEAFTIGALLEDGTELELDLNDLPGLPEAFYCKR